MSDTPRPDLLARGLFLEYLTIGWNIVEGVVAISAAVAAGSVALLGFGIDSFIECASGGVLIWRLRSETAGIDECAVERLEHRAERLVAVSFVLLASYIVFDAILALWNQDRPGRIGRRHRAHLAVPPRDGLAGPSEAANGRDLDSRALAADAVQTWACLWLSAIVLVGVGANALFGWWWADPVAALALCAFLIKEGREAWQGEGSIEEPAG